MSEAEEDFSAAAPTWQWPPYSSPLSWKDFDRSANVGLTGVGPSPCSFFTSTLSPLSCGRGSRWSGMILGPVLHFNTWSNFMTVEARDDPAGDECQPVDIRFIAIVTLSCSIDLWFL